MANFEGDQKNANQLGLKLAEYVDVNLIDNDGKSPLHVAVKK
jgi:hypothetical protein